MQNLRRGRRGGALAAIVLTLAVQGQAAVSLPGVVEAEAYDAASGVVSTAASAEGTYVQNIVAGQWMEYNIDVSAGGRYRVDVRLTVNSTGKTFELLVDSQTLTAAPVPIANMASWNRWGQVSLVAELPAGAHVLRLATATGLFNVNWIRFTPYVDPTTKDRAFYRFDNDGASAGTAAASVADQSVNANGGAAGNGPLYTAMIPTVAWPGSDAPAPNWQTHGMVWNKLALDFERDASQYILVNDADSVDLGSSGSFMVDFWVKLETPGNVADPATRQWVLHKKAAAADAASDYAILVNGADYASTPTWAAPAPSGYTGPTGEEIVLLFGQPGGSAAQAVVSRIKVSGTDKWHYVMVSYDGPKHEVIFVVDDQIAERVTGVTPTNVPNDGQLAIGGHITASGTVNQCFDGILDELRIGKVPLAGTPGNTNAFPSTTWFWQNEGTALDGMFTLEDRAPWRPRPSKMLEDSTSGWEVVEIPGEPGNYAFRNYDGPDLVSYYFFDHATTVSYDGTNYRKETCTPQNMSAGITFQMRFKLDDYALNEINSTSTQKFIRLVSFLQGATGANAFINFTLTGSGSNGIAIKDEGGSNTVSANLKDGNWHTIHTAAYVVEPALVRHVTWLDGSSFSQFDRTSNQNTVDPYIGFNDNNRRFMSDGMIDYVRLSGAGAWTPDMQPLSPFPEVCDNGIDDDVDGKTDCLDEDCAGQRVCCPHDPVFDANDDGDVDAEDFGTFQTCLTVGGAGLAGVDATCRCMDVAGVEGPDQVIDGLDFDAFVNCASGPGIMAATDCDD